MGLVEVQDKASGIAAIKSGATRVWFEESCKLGNDGPKDVAAVLKGNETLEALFFSFNQIGGDGASSLADALKKNHRISKLHLDNNQIGDVGASSLADALKKNQTLSELNLDNNQIGDVGASSLADALKKNITLSKLQLNKNQIDDAGASSLADALKKNQTLSKLHLKSNQFGDRGASSLAEALLENQKLKYIHLSSNNINDAGALLLVHALKENKWIETFVLGGEKITHAVATAMADVLQSNTSLKVLYLWDTQIGDVGASSIAKALEENKTLRTLNLSSNNITDVGASSLAEALKANQTLCDLELRFNPIEDESITSLIKARSKQNRDSSYEREEAEEAELEGHYEAALENGDLQEWGRAKLMVIGEGAAGKTSTVRSLLGIAPIKEHVSTVGVDLKVTRTDDWAERDPNASDYERMVNKAAAERKKNGGKPKVEVKKKMSVTKSVRESLSRMNRARSRKSLPAEDIVPSKDAARRLKEFAPMMDFNEVKALSLQKSSVADVSFSIWDYGGQEVFYALHHIFLSKQGVYLLVFDMTRILKLDEKAIEFVSIWVNSVKLHAPEAPVVMVGTRGDQVNSTPDLEMVNCILREKVKVVDVLKKSLVQNGGLFFFPIDNNIESRHRGIELRKAVEGAAVGLKCVKKLVPLAWMKILDDLIVSKEKHVTLQEVFQICEQYGVSKVQAKEMLATFHDRGVLVHQRATERLYEKVVIEPQWLLDKLSCVVNDELHSKDLISDSKLRDVQGDLIEYRRSGVATRLLLEVLWEDEEVDFLIEFLKETMLMCDFDVESGEKKYLVTSLILQEQRDDTGMLDLSDFEGGLTCVLDFSEFFLPIGVFQRLVSTCASVSSEEPRLGYREAIVFVDFDAVAIVERKDMICIRLIKDAKDTSGAFIKIISMVEEQKAVLMEDLVWKLLLQLPSDATILVDYSRLLKARESGDSKVWPEHSLKRVEVRDFDVFGCLYEDQPPSRKSVSVRSERSAHDVFISHNHQTAGDMAAVLAMKLESRGLRVWYDMSTEGSLAVPAMKEGIKASESYLLLLTKDVFESDAVKMELETALKLGKPIRLVHESQTNMAGFATFSEYIAGFQKFIMEMESCPANAKNLFEEEELMPYQRRKYLADPFIDELVKRIKNAK